MLDVCEFALSQGESLGADEVEVYAENNRIIRIAIQNNSIDLARSDMNEGVGIRAFKRHGLGYASCNSLSESDIKTAVENAISFASAAPRDPANYLPVPKETKKFNIFDPGSTNFNIESGLKFAVRLIESARKDERVSIDSGGFEATIQKRAIATSKGIREKESSNYFVYYLTGMAREKDKVSSFDVEFNATRWVKEIDVERIGRSLADKVLASLGAEKGKSFRGSVLLSPDAVESLVIGPLIFALNANNMQKGMSRFVGKRGSSVASSAFTLVDDGTLEGGIGTECFDREGMPHKRLPLIENGILSSFMYNY
jgi:PmbA protein